MSDPLDTGSLDWVSLWNPSQRNENDAVKRPYVSKITKNLEDVIYQFNLLKYLLNIGIQSVQMIQKTKILNIKIKILNFLQQKFPVCKRKIKFRMTMSLSSSVSFPFYFLIIAMVRSNNSTLWAYPWNYLFVNSQKMVRVNVKNE